MYTNQNAKISNIPVMVTNNDTSHSKAVPQIPIAMTKAVSSPLDVLMDYGGVVIRENKLTHWDEVDFGAFNWEGKFNIVPSVQNVSDRFDHKPSLETPILEFRESSACCCPYGAYICRQNRQAKFALYPALSSFGVMKGWPNIDVVAPLMIAERIFQYSDSFCCCCCCCYQDTPLIRTQAPLSPIRTSSSSLSSSPTNNQAHNLMTKNIGYVTMPWSMLNCLWPCHTTYNLFDKMKPINDDDVVNDDVEVNQDGEFQVYEGYDNPQTLPSFQIQHPCCFGACCLNLGAPTCIRKRKTFPIINKNGKRVGEIIYQFNGFGKAGKYIVNFPPESTAYQRANVLSALMLINLHTFTKL